jgi:hypothetical protein
MSLHLWDVRVELFFDRRERRVYGFVHFGVSHVVSLDGLVKHRKGARPGWLGCSDCFCFIISFPFVQSSLKTVVALKSISPGYARSYATLTPFLLKQFHQR